MIARLGAGRLSARGSLFAILSILVLAACGQSSPTSTDRSSSDSGTVPTGEITLALNVEPRSLASWESFATSAYPELRNIEEALLSRDAETNELVGELAIDWEQVEPTRWRFELRQGVKFHDGSDFNAEAAAFALNHTWSEENGFETRLFIGPEFTVEATDEFTIEVETASPDPLLPARLYFSPIFSRAAFEADPESYATTPVGTGPYRFVEWVRGDHITVEANPDWWGLQADDNGGRPTIQKATFVFRDEPDIRAAALNNDEAQFARWITRDQCESAPKCVSGPGIETVWLRIDLPNPALKDERVREAIALAIDKDAIINQIMGGGTLASMIIGPSALGFDPDLAPYPFDRARATELIAEAKADGVPVDTQLTVMANSEFVVHADESIELIAQELRDVGLTNVRIELRETAKFEEMWAQKPVPPERGVLGFDQHGNEMMDLSATAGSYYSCDGFGTTSCDPDLQDLIDAALPLVGDERKAALQEVANYIYDRVYTIPIGQPNLFFGLSDNLEWNFRLDGLILLKEMHFAG